MSGFSIAARLTIGFAVVVLLSLGLALHQLWAFRTAIAFLNTTTSNDNSAYARVVDIAEGRALLRRLRETALAAGADKPGISSDDYEAASQDVIARMGELEELARKLMEGGVSASRRQMWNRIAVATADMAQTESSIQARAIRMFGFLRQGQVAEAHQVSQSTIPDLQRLDTDMARIQEVIGHLSEQGRSDIGAVYVHAQRSAVITIVAVLAVGILAAWGIARSIGAPLERFVAFVRAIGSGDLTGRLPPLGSGELARLGVDLDRMTGSLRDVARQIRVAAEGVDYAVNQIRTSTQQQAASASEQAVSMAQTTATLTEITLSGAQITARAREVEHNAQAAAAASEDGLASLAVMGQAMDAIREQVGSVASTALSLGERTQAIGEIILTVSAIAERSHLLSLNAAIEAAGAGEHGQRFSVVASEIKRLADQAREATDRVRLNLGDIQRGIDTSVMLAEEAAKRVDAGLRQTSLAEGTIRGMAASIKESVQAFQQISAGVNQHQIGLEQVMQALNSIHLASSQSAAAIRQLEAAAGSLAGQSERMVAAIGSYRL